MKRITKVLSLLILLTFALVVVACGSVELSLAKDTLALVEGDSEKLEFTVSDETVKLVWESTEPTIVEVDQNGSVKALKEGKATVTVTVADKEISDSIEITVSKKPAPPVVVPTGVAIEAAVTEGKVGDSWTYVAKVLPAAAKQTVTWSTSNEDIATVSETGVVTLVGVGNVIITATSTENDKLEDEVEVKSDAPDPLSIIITSEENVTEVKVFETLQFSAVTSPDLASNEVTWSVDDDTLATISDKGLLSAIKEGKVTITATSTIVDTVTATFELDITRPVPATVTVTGSNTVIGIGEELILTTTISPVEAIQDVLFTSSDEAVATVDATGKVTAIGAGDVVITVKASAKEDVTATYDLTVIDVTKLDYSMDFILLDEKLTGQRFDKVTVDTKDYYIGLNAFTSAEAAFAALEENSTLLVKAGAYAEPVTIKVNGVKILGPNEGKVAGQDLSNRVTEAVFSEIITLDGVQDVLFDGIALTGKSQIRSLKPVKNITVQNLNGYGHTIPSGEGVIYAQVETATDVNENYVIKNSRLVDTFGVAPAGGYRGIRINNALNLEITNNYFVGFYDTIRLEGQKSGTGTGVSGAVNISNNVFENNFQYSIWIGNHHTSNIDVNDNYIGVRPLYTGVYGFIYIIGYTPEEGVKSVVNVLRNEMPYQVFDWHNFRFNSNGATAEQLEINANYNIFHEKANDGVSSTGAFIQYYLIADHYNGEDKGFRVNGTNNYYLFDSEVKADYFLKTNFDPYFTELSDELKIAALKRDLPKLINDDYQLPTLEGLVWTLKEGEDATLFEIETGTLLRVPGEREELVLVATLNEVNYEVTLVFGIALEGFTQVYYNNNAAGGTYETQKSTAGFSGYSILVGNKQYFLGAGAHIALSGTENQVLTSEELRPYGSGLGGDTFYNISLTVGGVPVEYKGYATIYENTGEFDLEFDLSLTYGRNNSGWAGYSKIVFSPQEDGTYKVGAPLADTGTNESTTGVMFTLKPGEILFTPHTYEASGTLLYSPKTDKPGVLAQDTIIQIITFKAEFAAAE